MDFGKNYKLLIIVPAILLVIAVGSLINQYSQTGDFFLKSIDLRGGTVITVNSPGPLDLSLVESAISGIGSFTVRETRSLEGYGTIIQTGNEINPDDVLAALSSAGFEVSDVSIESIGPSLGASFWTQAQLGMIAAFIFMGIIVFIIFRTFVPSIAVIISAVADITMTLGFMQIFGIELSLAAFAAILMLIGYSVDTDIMLTSRLLKESEEKTVSEKLRRALKTGLTMTFTSIGALAALLISSISVVLSEIAAVLLIGLIFDIINTWFTNSVILRWYVERRGA